MIKPFMLADLINAFSELWFGRDQPDVIAMGADAHQRFCMLSEQNSPAYLEGVMVLSDPCIPAGAIAFRNTERPNDPRFNRFLDFTNYEAERRRKEASFR